MKTETTVPTNLSLPMPQINKADLATKIRKYVIHSRFVILNSANPAYKNMRVLSHLDLCEVHSKMLKDPAGVSLKDICQYTLMIKKSLEGILPLSNNKSYESSCENLKEIFDQCYSYLNQIQKYES